MKTTDYILKYLKENLSDKRYLHSIGCAQSAQKLAKLFNIDEDKAYLAGLIHDCAKNFSHEKLNDIVRNKVKTGFLESELKNPKTYHAIAGTYILQNEFEIDDTEIINAVRYHTVGKVGMNLFEKIIFLADKIEPNSRDVKYTKKLWKLIKTHKGVIGLNLALLVCYCETIKSLIKKKLYICPVTIDVYNELVEQVGELLETE